MSKARPGARERASVAPETLEEPALAARGGGGELGKLEMDELGLAAWREKGLGRAKARARVASCGRQRRCAGQREGRAEEVRGARSAGRGAEAKDTSEPLALQCGGAGCRMMRREDDETSSRTHLQTNVRATAQNRMWTTASLRLRVHLCLRGGPGCCSKRAASTLMLHT